MPHIEVTRGARVEAVHPFSAVAVVDGQVVDRWGPPVEAAWRSAAKPFQLERALVALGGAGELLDEELAIGAASHAGQPEHIGLVRGLLARFGLDEAALACGPHPPLHAPSWEALVRRGEPVGDVHNNCSGKHAFMLAACAARGWGGDYRDPDHPLQRDVTARITALAGEAPGLAVDGCGVPTFFHAIDAIARAWATLAAAVRGGEGLLGRVGAAMMAHPHLTSGSGRLDEDLSAGRAEPLFVKIGAKALECVALPERRMAVVVKVHSGAEEALGEAVAEALHRFAPGAFQRPAGWARDKVLNVVGREVGALRLAAG